MVNVIIKDFAQGSKLLAIETVLLRVCEDAGVEVKTMDAEITTSKTEDFMMTTFTVKEITGPMMLGIEKSLGDRFQVKVIGGKGKSEVFITVEGPKQGFLNLANRVTYRMQQQNLSQTSSPDARTNMLNK